MNVVRLSDILNIGKYNTCKKHHLFISCSSLFFFACPPPAWGQAKRNPDLRLLRFLATKQRPALGWTSCFRKGSFNLAGLLVKYSGTLMASRITSFKAQTVKINKHE